LVRPRPIRNPVPYLLSSPEPWVKYNTLLNIAGLDSEESEVQSARDDLLNHPRIAGLIRECETWPDGVLKRHNDAGHVIHKIGLLADLGLKIGDLGVSEVADAVLFNRSGKGMPLSNLLVPKSFGGDGVPRLGWMLCDAPLLIHALASFGLDGDAWVVEGARFLASLVDDNGWRCRGSIPGFRGPGRKDDHCPYANLISLKALSMFPELRGSEACRWGVETQLAHWEGREGRKIYMFGIGSTFTKLKYPNVWYDILHVVDVLSRFPRARGDDRFMEMLELVNSKEGEEWGFVPESVWRAYSGWSFGQKREASHWLTYRIAMINARMGVKFSI
jgi:hypothetical protein